MLYGPGAYVSRFTSTRIFGVAGEGIQTFWRPGGVLALVPLTLMARFCRDLYRTAAATEGGLGRKFIAPALPIMAVLALSSELDNLLLFALDRVFLQSVLVFLARAPEGESGELKCSV